MLSIANSNFRYVGIGFTYCTKSSILLIVYIFCRGKTSSDIELGGASASSSLPSLPSSHENSDEDEEMEEEGIVWRGS